jgi:YidC/Oxa1 family membrane protein insertase
MKLYREAGFNPLGCFSSMLLQFPILIALYRTFIYAVGEAPESLIGLEERLYNWDYLRSGLPVPGDFLWLHLGRPDPFVLPLLVAASTYVLQKMSTLPTADERQRAQMQMMNLLMPLLFAWITLSLPSGLGLYYVLSNVIGMVMQYAYIGGGPFNWRAIVGLSQEPVLPRALEVRKAQSETFGRLGQSEDEEEPRAEPRRTPLARQEAATERGVGGGKRRRRRYGRGRR